MEIHGYTKDGAISATINGEHVLVPDDMANRDRQMIAEWEEKGNAIPAYVPPPAPTPDLEPWRFFAMLDLSGKRPALEAFIDALPEPGKTVAKAKMQYSLTFKFDNDLVQTARVSMGLPMTEFAALWSQALTL